ncbi:hypothetical protein B0H19DRAFT_521712 [Mycena capillaripes]|nr:hypothetical protein B0H19DRAFT_521712 [Mycena capillaripes]
MAASSFSGQNNTSLLSDSADKSVDPSLISRDILDTNDPPAELNISSLREFVSRGSARRAYLDSKIAPLKAELERLLEERNALDTEIRKHEGALSPLRHMPTEIISLIFIFALPPFAFHENVMSVREGPWVLAAVCSRWRKIVLSQPRFWTSLFLDFTDDPPESASLLGLVQTVEAHLERSQQLPLRIIFRPFYHDVECTERERDVLELLVQHCDRWETVTLSGPRELYTLLDEIRDNLPILRKLDVSVDEYLENPLDLFESCPKLQEVFVNANIYGGSHPLIAELPFSQLRRYSAENSWTNHAHALRSASNLVDCVLHLRGSSPTSGNAIVLPQLLRLSVSTTGVLNRLETPALQELYCSDHSTQLHSFLKRLPKLQKLVVPETPSAPDIARLLHAAPTITNLCLFLPMGFASDLFSILENPSQNADTPISALHALSICLVPLDRTLGGPLDEDHLMRTVESQWRNGRLRSLKLYGMKFVPSATTLERMGALREQGMEIIHFERSYDLYLSVVPGDFRLYRDQYDLLDRLFDILMT